MVEQLSMSDRHTRIQQVLARMGYAIRRSFLVAVRANGNIQAEPIARAVEKLDADNKSS